MQIGCLSDSQFLWPCWWQRHSSPSSILLGNTTSSRRCVGGTESGRVGRIGRVVLLDGWDSYGVNGDYSLV